MNLADNVGQLLINSDVAYAHKGAAGLVVFHQTGQPITAAEGFLARFVSTGTKRDASYAVGITVPLGQPAMAINSQVVITGVDNSGLTTLNVVGNDTTQNTHALDVHNEGSAAAVLITPDDTDTPALLVTGKANSTVTVVTIDGASGAWIGGVDDVAMVEITGGSTANADAGGGLLAVISDTNPAATSEGFLCRFIHTGTATTDAYAVQIETTNTTPCLQLNNQMTIAGSASGGIMLDITGADTSTDTVTLVGVGTGDVLQITANATTATGLKIIGAINGAAALAYVDGASVNWIGANDVGMLSLIVDTPATNAGSTLCFIQTAASPIAASEGFLLRLEQKTGAAVTDAYAMQISTTDTTPCLQLNNQLTITGGATAGVLMDITSVDADNDTVQLTGAGSADVLQITSNATASVGLNVIAKASGTTADIYVNAKAGWLGAADVGLVTIESDSALTDNAASLLVVINKTGQIKDGATGHLARFVDAAAARTGSFGVEINMSNTAPALLVNNQIKSDGADSTGILLLIDGEDTTGDTDSIVQTHDGDGSAFKMTLEAPAGMGLEIIGDAAGTHPQINIDLETGAWVGAATTGALEITNDGFLVEDASLLRLENKGQIAVANDGACLEVIDSGAARATSYAVRIASTSNEALHVDTGLVVIDEGLTIGTTLGVTGDVTASGSITGDGGDELVGYLTLIEIEGGTAEQLLVGDSGTLFTNTNAAGETTYTLPDAAAGLWYIIADTSKTGADDVQISPQVGDTIDGDTAGDDLVSSSDDDAYCIIYAIDGVRWITIQSQTGTWTAD